MNKNILIAVLILVSGLAMNAQQDAQYTQYMYNTLSVNPAYAGSRGVLSITGLHRSQWVGLDGAPTTQTLNFHTPVGRRVGVGLSIINDEIGNSTRNETNFDGAVSYTIPMSNSRKLSFGLKVGGHLLNIDFSKLAGFTDEQGSNGIVNIDNKFSPNFGAGVYYHTDQFYFGFSIPNFMKTNHFDSSEGASSVLVKDRVSYYLISGYIFDLNGNLKFKPTILAKTETGAPLQVDLSANFLINNRLLLGAAYRWDASFSALTGFQITNKVMLGLAYDREITELGNTSFNDGSFEIFLRYELFNNSNRVVTPRFF
jgi:type IX secretion system PorP/SprF family membrane protein